MNGGNPSSHVDADRARGTVDVRLLHPGRRADRDGVIALLDALPRVREELFAESVPPASTKRLPVTATS